MHRAIDAPTNDFFAQVLETRPKINAAEMQGAGVAAAIDQTNRLGISTRFMIVRLISDLSHSKGKNISRKDRDDWKNYASNSVADFVIGWINIAIG